MDPLLSQAIAGFIGACTVAVLAWSNWKFGPNSPRGEARRERWNREDEERARHRWENHHEERDDDGV
jgi:hypothetical protein